VEPIEVGKEQDNMAQTDTYTSSDTWTAPAGVTSVDVEVWAGGGGGAGEDGTQAGGGGGGGAYSKKVDITVTPETGYTVTVGTGGQGGNEDVAGGDGGDSWFSTTGTVFAEGGEGGNIDNNTSAGGNQSNGVGDTKYSGGNGGAGGSSNGGGGGGGAGSGGNGGNGSNGNGGSASGGTAGSPDGGAGGAGSASSGADGSPGSILGGGGGGTGDAGGDNTTGDGARGKVTITYEVSTSQANSVRANITRDGLTNANSVRAYLGSSFYTRGYADSLPANDDDLSTAYSTSDLADVLDDDATRVSQVGGGYIIHQFKWVHTNNTDPITPNIDMQSDTAPSTSTVVLQIYNRNSTTWENLDTDSTTAANTDFTLSETQSSNLSNYYDAQNMVSVRVYQFNE
jgi:hypothetical protein